MKSILLSVIILLFVVHSSAQTIQLANVSQDVFCSSGSDTMRFSVNYTNIPQNSNIVFYQSTNPAFNPYLGQGDSIAFINVGGNTSGGGGQVTTTCPEILGIFIDACDQGGILREVDNEYMVITSGNSGFNVSDLKLQMPNTSINITGCPFGTPSAATMTQLRNGTCDATTLIAAGQGDFIPANAIVIIFTGRGALYNYNFSSYCSSGQPIYILQNSCSPGTANFVNNAPSSCPGQFRTTTITVGACFDRLTYNPCTLTPFDAGNPNANDGNYVIHLTNTDTSSVTNGGIRNNAADKCNGLRFDSISGATIIKYPIPNDGGANPATNFCNTGYHYIKAITNPNGTQPVSNTIQFKLVCLDLTATTPNGNICSGQNAVINNNSTDPNATITWTVSGGANITGESSGNGNIINQVLSNTTSTKDSVIYSITATDAGCTINRQVKIVVNPTLPKPNLGNDTAICGAISKTLTTGNSTTTWTLNNNPLSNNVASITATQAGTYIASITGFCGNVADTIVITQTNTQPKPNLGNDTSFCSTISKLLTTGIATTNWIRNGTQIATNTATITATQTGTYIANVTGTCGTSSDTIVISQSANINFDFGAPSTTVCVGSNITLDASTAYDTYTWSTGAATSNITISLPGKYWVDVFKNGCKGTDTIQVLQSDKEPKPNLGPDISACNPLSQALSTGKVNTTWYLTNTSNQVGTGANFTATQFGTYIAKLTNSCGDVFDTIVITQATSQPPINLGNDTSYCGAFTRVLSTGNAATVWSTGITASSITVTSPGTYTATINVGCGIATDAITLSQAPGINFDFGSSTTSVCAGSNITLDASTAYDTYVWSTGAGTSSITISLPGKYWVDVFKNGCKGSDTIQVLQSDKPVKPNIGNDTTICGAFSKVLSNGNVQTEWFRNNVAITNAIAVTVTQSGTYIARVTNSCGSSADTIVISNANAFSVNLGRDTTLCTGASFVLNATTSGSTITYIWSTGESTPTITVTQFGRYDVEVSNGTCSSFDTILVDFINKPTISSLGNDTSFCGNFSLQLFTGDANTIWSTGVVGPQINATQGGTIIAENRNQCGSAKDTVEIQQFALPVLNLGRDTTVCDSIVLSIGNDSFTSVLWNTSDTTASIVASSSGLFSVRVSNANCTNSDSVRINKECFYEVYIPTAFSPNQDNVNDFIAPLSYVKGMLVLEFMIFNRWGELVYEAVNFTPDKLSSGWNGIFKGEPAHMDQYAYIYTVKMPDDKVKTYKGTFALLR